MDGEYASYKIRTGLIRAWKYCGSLRTIELLFTLYQHTHPARLNHWTLFFSLFKRVINDFLRQTSKVSKLDVYNVFDF